MSPENLTVIDLCYQINLLLVTRIDRSKLIGKDEIPMIRDLLEPEHIKSIKASLALAQETKTGISNEAQGK